MSSILSSFPTPPTHVPVPSPRYLSTFLVGNLGGGEDANGNGNGNGGAEDYIGSLPLYSANTSHLSTRSRSASSSSYLSSLASLPFPITTTSPSLVPFPTSPMPSISLGPPPALPLPPLPSLPSPISPEDQVAFARASYSSNAGSAKSLRSVSSIGSMRSVNSMQSVSKSKNREGQSLRSVSSSAASLRSMATDSSGSGTSVGTHMGTVSNGMSNGKGAYASSVSEYEESILDVELDFESDQALEEDGDEDEILIKKKPKLATTSSAQNQSHVTFPARTTRFRSNTTSATRPPGSPSAQSRSRTSSIHTSSMRARSNSRPRTRINSTTNNSSSSNSTLRVRTVSQPSSQVPHYSYQTRTRTISSYPPPTQPPNRIPDSTTIPFTSYTSSKQNPKTKFSTQTQNSRPSITSIMSISPSPAQYLSPSTPIDVSEPTTPLTNSAFPPSTPQLASSDRSTSPDLQALLSHTSEVLKSGGKVRSSSRPSTGDRRPLLSDRRRTSSTFSGGSKLSTGSVGSTSLNENVKRNVPRSPFSNHDDGSSRSLHLGSTKPRSRLRSDSKSSLVSKSSSANMKMGYLDDSPTHGAPIATSSRVSLIDESFEDERDLFEEGLGGEGRGDDAFTFFNPSNSFNTGEDDPTLTFSFPIIEDEDGENMIDLKTPLPHLLLRAGVLSPNSKLLPRSVDSSDEERGRGKKSKGRASPNGSVVSSMTTATTSSKHPRDARDTVKRRIRHKDGRLLRGGIGLTTGLGWSDSEDEDAPSEFTTRLKRLASMGGLSALSRKSSMASNMSGFGTGHAASMSNASNSGYGSVYGESVGTNGYTPSVSVSQSGSRERTSMYTDASRGSLYSDLSHSGRYPNGASIHTASASSSRNVSRQSSFSIPYHGSNHSPFDGGGRKEFEIVEEEVEDRLANKDKERGRKTASMVHVKERELNFSGGSNVSDGETERENDGEMENSQKLGVPPSSSFSFSSSSQRNSTLSVSSISSAHSNTLTLNPPSIAGSLTPTPETPTTPTPVSSFGIASSHDSSSVSNPTVQSTIPSISSTQPSPLSGTKQTIRLNTNLSNVVMGRSHSPVPPPSPAPTGPLPPTPGDVDVNIIKGKFGRSHVALAPTSGSGTFAEISAPIPQSQIVTNTTTTMSSTSRPSSASSQQRVISPPPSHPARVTSPSFSMPTSSRTIHPARSRAGSLSSRESGYSIASVQSKTSAGSMGNGAGSEDKSRLPYVAEDDGDGVLLNVNEKGPSTSSNADDSMKYLSDSKPSTMFAPALPSPIDPDAVAIIEVEPSEYGDDIAVALTGEEDEAGLLKDHILRELNNEKADIDVEVESVRSLIPEYPYRFDVPPSPVTSVRPGMGPNGDAAISSTGSFGFRKVGGKFQTPPISSSGLGKYSVSVSGSGIGSAIPSVAFSPQTTQDTSPLSQMPHHEHASSISSIDTSESTASLFGAGRPDHMRMDSWNQSFSVFGSGMGVPPPEDTGVKTAGIGLGRAPTATSTLKSSVSLPQSQAPRNASISSTPSTSMPSFVARSASPMLARARAASPISSISSMRVGSSLGFSSNVPKPSSSTGPSGRTTPSSQLGLTPSQLQRRGPSPVPSSKAMIQAPSSTTNSSSSASPIIPAPRKSSLPLPPSFSATPGRPTSPPPPPPSAAGHMPSLLLRPTAGIARKGSGGIPRPSHTTPTPTTPTPTPTSSSSSPLSSPSISTTPSTIPSRSSMSPHSMLPQPGRRVGTPVMRYGTPGLSAGKRTS